ncbi:GDSL-type esterase/lipase family protein [Alkalinema sp. FACHB-956]|uniref:GDSL-type esterase/lipase family protein n=1 Tax=Alkalinema sp. FACHB-956 TaxID=2692768 RepID=UPI001682EBED|nr:GDSL-type esterase/lipase family protein [Alkalinema sp. FACHB-956]MBD2326404.1 lipase [Alkalinema sp. FACHB-956]
MHVLASRDRRICFLGDSFINGTGDPDCLGWTGRICAMAQQRGRAGTAGHAATASSAVTNAPGTDTPGTHPPVTNAPGTNYNATNYNATNYNVTYYNLGIRRETSAELRQRWRSEVQLRLPEDCDGRLVFSFGTNDTTWENGQPRVALADSLIHARSILTVAQRQYPVLLVSPPPIADAGQNDRTWVLIEALESLCKSLAIPFLDVFTPLQCYTPWLDEVKAFDGAHPGSQGYGYLAELVATWSAWQGWWSE